MARTSEIKLDYESNRASNSPSVSQSKRSLSLENRSFAARLAIV
jgi:hypothetical protein